MSGSRVLALDPNNRVIDVFLDTLGGAGAVGPQGPAGPGSTAPLSITAYIFKRTA